MAWRCSADFGTPFMLSLMAWRCDSDRTLPTAALPMTASRLTKLGELSVRPVLWLKLVLGGASGMGGLGHANRQPAMAAATAAA